MKKKLTNLRIDRVSVHQLHLLPSPSTANFDISMGNEEQAIHPDRHQGHEKESTGLGVT